MVNAGTLVGMILSFAAGTGPDALDLTAPGAGAEKGLPELSLAGALLELDRQNLTVVEARERAAEAEAAVTEVGSALIPTVSALGSYVRNRDEFAIKLPANLGPGIGLPPGGAVIQPLAQLSAAGSVRIPLIVPTAWFDLGQARSVARGSLATVDATRLEVRTGFAQSAYGALAGEEVVAAAERALADAAELTRSAKRRVAAGTSAPIDILKAQTEEVARRSDLAGARADLDRARFALGVLLGRDGPVRVLVPEVEATVSGEEGTAEEDLAREALADRPELTASAAQIDAAESAKSAAWARLAPTVTASAKAFAANVPYPTGKTNGWQATVDLTWVVFDGGLWLGKRREAEAQAAGARAGAEAERLAILKEVHDGWRDLSVAGEQLELAKTRRELAAESAASARRSFEAGVASSLEVIDANDRLFTADVALASARARFAQAHLELLRATGRG